MSRKLGQRAAPVSGERLSLTQSDCSHFPNVPGHPWYKHYRVHNTKISSLSRLGLTRTRYGGLLSKPIGVLSGLGPLATPLARSEEGRRLTESGVSPRHWRTLAGRIPDIRGHEERTQ